VRLSWSFRNGVKRPNNRRGATLDPKTHGICGRNGWKKVQVYSGNLPGKHMFSHYVKGNWLLVLGVKLLGNEQQLVYPAVRGGIFG